MTSVFIRLLDEPDKARALRAAAAASDSTDPRRFALDPETFRGVPRSPFAYAVSEQLRSLFRELPSFEGDGRTARTGARTLDDVRFVRMWTEVPHSTPHWIPLAKGGSAARFYSGVVLALKWDLEGREIKAHASAIRESKGWGPQWSAVLNAHDYYFTPGVTWPHRSARLTAAVLPAGCIFTQSGKAAFAPPEDRGWLLALLNSEAATLLLRVQSDEVRIKFEVGLIQQLPVPQPTIPEKRELAAFAHEGWAIAYWLDSCNETSRAFATPSLLRVAGSTIRARGDAWRALVREQSNRLATVRSSIDERCARLYGLNEADRLAAEGGTSSQNTSDEAQADDEDEERYAEQPDSPEALGAGDSLLAADLVSWAVGVAFGRFDIRLTAFPLEALMARDAFAAMPQHPPGLLLDENGGPGRAPSNYPLTPPPDGVLVDDPGHPRDLTAAVREVLDHTFGELADEIWEELTLLLAPKDRELRAWFSERYFAHHLRQYSQLRRKSPLYWQLASAPGRYSIWLYTQRLTRDSLYQVIGDYVAPKLADEERRHTALVQTAGPTPTKGQRKEIAAQGTFVEELRELKEKLAEVAPAWDPDLNDGNTITASPLRDLFPHHKPWQKELNTTWKALTDGKYDWARIAIHHWPERVIPKAHEDRSLAIAHNLETTLWQQDQDNNWRPNPHPDLDRLVQEHRR